MTKPVIIKGAARHTRPPRLRPWQRDHAHMSAAYAEFDTMTERGMVQWIVSFAHRRDLATLGREERVQLGYQVRALSAITAGGWMSRRPVGPLADRDLRHVQSSLAKGLHAWTASASAALMALPARDNRATAFIDHETLGWRLPPHRERYVRMPTPSDDPAAWTPTIRFYRAKTEQATLVVTLAHFLLAQQPKHLPRVCACGCDEQFFADRADQRFLNEAHGNVFRQRKWTQRHSKKGASV